MSTSKNKGWFVGIFAFVALFTGSSMIFSSEMDEQPSYIQFSNLSDSDLDMILAVKAEMRAANVQSN